MAWHGRTHQPHIPLAFPRESSREPASPVTQKSKHTQKRAAHIRRFGDTKRRRSRCTDGKTKPIFVLVSAATGSASRERAQSAHAETLVQVSSLKRHVFKSQVPREPQRPVQRNCTCPLFKPLCQALKVDKESQYTGGNAAHLFPFQRPDKIG